MPECRHRLYEAMTALDREIATRRRRYKPNHLLILQLQAARALVWSALMLTVNPAPARSSHPGDNGKC